MRSNEVNDLCRIFRVLLPSKVIWGADFDSDIHFALRRLETRSWNHRVIKGQWRHMTRKWFFEFLTPKNYPWAFTNHRNVFYSSQGTRWTFKFCSSSIRSKVIGDHGISSLFGTWPDLRGHWLTYDLNPRPVRGGWCNPPPPPPWVFLSWTPHRLEDRAEIFHSLWGILCATFGEKKLVGSGQVTKLWRQKRNNLRKISAKSWINATWRGAIDLNGDSWWDWCQYMTGCDPWHCARWGSRSTEVTWGHWPRLTSQWQLTNRHMSSGVSWGAESESVVHCP